MEKEGGTLKKGAVITATVTQVQDGGIEVEVAEGVKAFDTTAADPSVDPVLRDIAQESEVPRSNGSELDSRYDSVPARLPDSRPMPLAAPDTSATRPDRSNRAGNRMAISSSARAFPTSSSRRQSLPWPDHPALWRRTSC